MITRRRLLAISAAVLAVPTTGQAQPIYTWTGTALGARATLRLAHPDAKAITARVAGEISRLEDIFSLFRKDSALSKLNATGGLQSPPFEMLECLSLVGAVYRASEGRFDPTIQPLWDVYADASAKGLLPDDETLRAAQSRTGWESVTFDTTGITMRPGMALTLNGIAQGYIADRVAALLDAEGLTNILIDTGEFRALGTRPDGTAWPIKLQAGGVVALKERALATSAPLGTTFDAAATQGHILDPRTGRPTRTHWREITVTAKSAALADGLSTAACLYQARTDIEACIAQFEGARLEASTSA